EVVWNSFVTDDTLTIRERYSNEATPTPPVAAADRTGRAALERPGRGSDRRRRPGPGVRRGRRGAPGAARDPRGVPGQAPDQAGAHRRDGAGLRRPAAAQAV